MKGYSTHESETLQKVIEARAKATSVTIDAENLNEETLAKYQQAQGELSQALKSLLAVTEAYPDLKANENLPWLCRRSLRGLKTAYPQSASVTLSCEEL